MLPARSFDDDGSRVLNVKHASVKWYRPQHPTYEGKGGPEAVCLDAWHFHQFCGLTRRYLINANVRALN